MKSDGTVGTAGHITLERLLSEILVSGLEARWLTGYEVWMAGWLYGLVGWLALRPGWLAVRPGWLALRPGWLAGRPGCLARRPGCLARRPGCLAWRPGWLCLEAWLAGWLLGPWQGHTNKQMNQWTDKKYSILRDFVL